MQVITLPEFTAGARNRAQKTLNIIYLNPSDIGSREYDRCFEMFDGKDVALLIMHTLKSGNIGFNQLHFRVQHYFGISGWNYLEKEYNEFIQTQISLF